jgi:hypothetical protein
MEIQWNLQHFKVLHIYLSLGNVLHNLSEADKNIILKMTKTEIYFVYRRKPKQAQNSGH